MLHPLKSLCILIAATALINSCKPTSPSEEPKPKTFSDYASAETWVKQTHKAETITPESSLIKQMDYFPAEGNGYLIIALHKENKSTLLYQNISPKLWDDFKNAKSKGKFYNKHIQGNEDFILKIQK
jgi:hypothetical protein